MNVEILIYAYLAICLAMIAFNIASALALRMNDPKASKKSDGFSKTVLKQLESGGADERHRRYLRKKLRHINYLMELDGILEGLFDEKPDEVRRYVETLSPVFVYLTLEYSRKNQLQAAYYPYIIKKYRLFTGTHIKAVVDMLTHMVQNSSLYCRENALQALYNIGDAGSVVNALKLLDGSGYYHNPRMITDGLLEFTGDREELDRRLWACFGELNAPLQLALMEYFRFDSGRHAEKMLEVMTDSSADLDLRLAAIRYFAKYSYEPAREALYSFACDTSPEWEYRAIAATALAEYPAPKTERILRELLFDRNWYVRYNAADSLERLGVEYDELIDIFEGDDRYASEMLRYRFDRKKLGGEMTV